MTYTKTQEQYINTLNDKELKTFNFCIKMGDSFELAKEAVEISRENRSNQDYDSYYRSYCL